MSFFTKAISWLWWRRFHWLIRVGWRNVRGSGVADARVGWALLAVGYLLQRRRRKRRLRTRGFDVYAPHGMSVRVVKASQIVTERGTGI